MTTNKISRKPKKHEEAKKNFMVMKKLETFKIYEPVKGDKVIILLHSIFPSYDFLFGIPDKANSNYGKEVAFFQFRDTRKKKINEGFYLDKEELEDFVKGFGLIKEISKMQRPELWKKKIKTIYAEEEKD